MKLFVLVLTAIALSSFGIKEPQREIKNFHPIDKVLFRSGQPNHKDMVELERIGIKTIVNLRNVCSDKHEIRKTALKLSEVPMRAKKITYEDIVETLVSIQKAEKPVLIHCLHGSDRTGCMVAAYRMVFNNFSKQQAIDEFLEEQYGYNRKLFPNILELLQMLDIEKLKKDVNCRLQNC